MKTNDQLLAEVRRAALDEVKELPDSPEARARTVAQMQAALSQAAPPKRAPGRGWRLALAAGLALLLGASVWFAAQPDGVGRVVASGGTLAVGHRVLEAEVLESGEATLTVQLPPGVLVHLRPKSAVEIRNEGARVVVRRGDVAAEVTSRDAAFFLEAGDTEVATRGARFTLSSGAGCDGHSQVEVTAGSVVINGAANLQAGEHWPRCSPAPAPELAAPSAPAPEVLPVPVPVRPVVTKRMNAPPPPVKDDERLARQNELYLQALTLQRAGEVRAAVKKLEDVLADAASPLAETALAQKMKWLSATDRAAAREVAQDYLQRFPMGFGRADAEQLVLEPQ